MAFNQCRNIRISETRNEIAFPMTGHRPIFDLRWSIRNGNGIDDLTPPQSSPAAVLWLTKCAPGT